VTHTQPVARVSPATLWLGLALVSILALSALIFQLARDLEKRSDLVTHTAVAQNTLATLESRLLAAETGQRGYLITGDTTYLTPHNEALPAIPRDLKRLDSLTTDNPGQQARLAELRGDIDALLGVLARGIEAYRRGGQPSAFASVQTGDGQRLMRSVRSDLAKMRAEEDRLLALRLQQKEGAFAATEEFLVLEMGVLTIALLLGGLVWRAQSSQARSQAERNRALVELGKAEAELRRYAGTLEERVAARTAELTRSNAELEAFSYTVAHDLRAPLRAINGYLHLLLSEHAGSLSTPGHELTTEIHRATQRMDELIGDLLAFSRLGFTAANAAPVPLDETIASAIAAAVAGTEAEQGLPPVEVSLSDSLPPVHAERAGLVQAIANLISNARKFVQPGREPRVRISATECGPDRVRLVVQDNGIGIAAEHQERIFRVFERLHGADDFPGTGIGLAIVRRAVERVGGTVGVDSEPGQGSSFWIELKRADQAR
jgi:signal transduction histidine kinase